MERGNKSSKDKIHSSAGKRIDDTARKRYNEKSIPEQTSTLAGFGTEDQALEYLAEVMVEAYFQQKTL